MTESYVEDVLVMVVVLRSSLGKKQQGIMVFNQTLQPKVPVSVQTHSSGLLFTVIVFEVKTDVVLQRQKTERTFLQSITVSYPVNIL